MNADDDISPLVEDEEQTTADVDVEPGTNTEQDLGLTECRVQIDPELEEVIYGYRKSRWRTALVYLASALCGGIPLLVFHWCPTWLLYSTSVRVPFPLADVILVVETYQKKCKSFYIHKILQNHISDTGGLSNEAYQSDNAEQKVSISDALDIPIHLDDGTKLYVQSYRYFRHKKCVLIWDAGRGRFARLGGIDSGVSCDELHRLGAAPPTHAKRNIMQNVYGLNLINVPVQSIMTLVLLEVFNPFYVFQLFTIAVWLAEPYYYYCVAVVLMSTFGVATSVIQTKKNQRNLRNTVESHETVQLLIEDRLVEVSSAQAAPGDVLVLPSRGCRLHCDAVLLNGSAVLNESMLTGESVPVTKTALPRVVAAYDDKQHAAHTLYCGTRLIQTRYYDGEPVKALVLRTGYNTSKGQLVRSILYPIPADFKFDRDSYKFILILAGIAMVGLAYTVALKMSRALSARDIVIKALDIITIVIPPALPAAMTVGRLYAVARLQRARVACLNTRAVNVSGSLDCICFDKTGTLTEEGLDLWGVVPAVTTLHPPALGPPLRDPRLLNDLDDLKLGLATCHSLTIIDGELAGDPLDLKMFESTGWCLEEPEVPETANYEVLTPTIVKPRKQANINVDDFHVPLEVGIVHQNQFLSSLQRSSVAVRVRGEGLLRVYCKGAPETVAALCRKDTVPHNLNEVLGSHAQEGYRVIALATRLLDATHQQLQKMNRDEMECDLQFLGLVIMENRLKGATTGIIRELKEANIHVAMVTGDNIHTAVSVARECGILQPGARVVRLYCDPRGEKRPLVYCDSTLHGVPVGVPSRLSRGAGVVGGSVDSGHVSEWSGASAGAGAGAGTGAGEAAAGEPTYQTVLTGDTWRVLREHYPDMIPRIIARGAVFARMSSDQKQQLIVDYQAMGYYVGMCGDGANDCGALRAAHAGVSLSHLESSAAAAFTSTDADLVALSRVLREGRAALATSFGVFKFMIAYSLAEFLSVAFLYYFDSNLTDFQFLFIDVGLIVNFAFFFGRTEAYRGKLCRVPPLASLLGVAPLLSLLGQLAFVAAGQYASYYAISRFPWYVRHTYRGEEENECWENYAIFAVSMFQYVILAVVFSHGAPYRRSVVTNGQLMLSVVIMTAICVYIAVAPAEWLARFLQLQMPLDILMCYIVLAIAGCQLLVALFYERVVVQYLMQERRMVPRFLKERVARKTPHVMIGRQLTDSDYLNFDNVLTYDRETGNITDSSSSVKAR